MLHVPSRTGWRRAAAAFVLFAFALSSPAATPTVEQLTELFLPAEFGAPKVSPDGKFAAFLVAKGNDSAVAIYTFATSKVDIIATKGIDPIDLWWKTSHHVLIQTTTFERDAFGYTLIDVTTGQSDNMLRMIDPFGRIIDPLPNDPDAVLMLRGNEIGHVKMRSGNFSSDSMLGGIGTHVFLDANRGFRAYYREDTDGSVAVKWRSGASGKWQLQDFRAGEKSFRPIGIADNGTDLLTIDSTEGNEAAFSRLDTSTGARTLLARKPGLDPTYVMYSDPLYQPVAAVYAQGPKVQLVSLSEARRAGVELLEKKTEGLLPTLMDATNPNRWVIQLQNSRIPGVYALFDSTTGELKPILRSHHRALTEDRLSPAEFFSFQRRNGALLTGRLWRPVGVKSPPLIVLAPERLPGLPVLDQYDAHTQALVALGFAVIRVNVRGTSGFGSELSAAADGDVGQTLTEDLEDAVDSLVSQQVVDGKRVAIMGRDLGGMLAVLVAQSSNRFAAVVGLNFPASIGREDLLLMSNTGNSITFLSDRLGGWWKTGALARKVSPVAVAPQVHQPALYLFNESSSRGKVNEEGRELASAVKSTKVPAEIAIAYPYSSKRVPPLTRAHESAVIVEKMATFLNRVMPPTAAAESGN